VYRARGIRSPYGAPAGCSSAWPRVPASDAGDRWFESNHPDHFLSRSSVDESTAFRKRGTRVRVAPGQPVRKVARGGTQPVSKAGPTSRSKVRLLRLPPIIVEIIRENGNLCHLSMNPPIPRKGRIMGLEFCVEDFIGSWPWGNRPAPSRRTTSIRLARN